MCDRRRAERLCQRRVDLGLCRLTHGRPTWSIQSTHCTTRAKLARGIAAAHAAQAAVSAKQTLCNLKQISRPVSVGILRLPPKGETR